MGNDDLIERFAKAGFTLVFYPETGQVDIIKGPFKKSYYNYSDPETFIEAHEMGFSEGFNYGQNES